MISITKAEVPAYLQKSEFYASLGGDESDEFSVPEGNFKSTAEVKDQEQCIHLLHTLRYWGVKECPDELTTYLVSNPNEECEQMHELLSEFEWFSGLSDWFKAISDLDPGDSASVASYMLNLGKLASYLFVTNASQRRKTILAFTVVASADQRLGGLVFMSVMQRLPELGKQITEETPLADVRGVACFLSAALKHQPASVPPEQIKDIFPLLAPLLSWPDDEVVLHTCRAVFHIASHDFDVDYSSMTPRLVELLNSTSCEILETALKAVLCIAGGTEEQTQSIMDPNPVPALLTIVSMRGKRVSCSALVAFCNLIAGSPRRRDLVLSHHPLPALMDAVAQPDRDVAFITEFHELMVVLFQALDSEIARELAEIGAIPTLCWRLLMDSDERKFQTLSIFRKILDGLSAGHDTPSSAFLTARAQMIEHGVREFAFDCICDASDNARTEAVAVHHHLVDRYK